MDSTCLLISKSCSSPDDGQYVPSTVKIIELHRWWTVRAFSGQNDRATQRWTVRAVSGQNHIAWQMMDSTCLLMSKSYSSPDDGQYAPSHVTIIELPWRWTVRAFSGQDHRAPHHVRRSWRLHALYVKIIELPRWWTVRALYGLSHRDPQMMDSTCLLMSKS